MNSAAMGPDVNIPDFWAMSDRDLAQICLLIAQGQPENLDAFDQAEAARLYLLWQEVMDAPSRTPEEAERRVKLLAGLRRRTIEFLIGLGRKGELPTPEH